jgi:hypothetical protein
MQTLIHRDSKPWQLQVWASFLIAVFLCAVGLSWLPGKDLDRAFMIMGYFFCLSAAFVLAKYVRDQEQSRAEGRLTDTPMFKLVVWGGFFLAMSLTGWGLWRMEINETYKAFLGVSWLYLITCTFTLAKTLRDRHEADLSEARLAGRASRSNRQRIKEPTNVTQEFIMKNRFATYLIAVCTAFTLAGASFHAKPSRRPLR